MSLGKGFSDRHTVLLFQVLCRFGNSQNGKLKIKQLEHPLPLYLPTFQHPLRLSSETTHCGMYSFTGITNHLLLCIPVHFTIHLSIIYSTNNHWAPFIFWVLRQILGIQVNKFPSSWNLLRGNKPKTILDMYTYIYVEEKFSVLIYSIRGLESKDKSTTVSVNDASNQRTVTQGLVYWWRILWYQDFQ